MYLFIKRIKKLVLVLNLPTSCDNLPTKCDKTVGFLTSTSKLLSFALYRIRCDMLWAHCFSCRKPKKKGVFERNSVLMKEAVTEHVITLFPCDIIFFIQMQKKQIRNNRKFLCVITRFFYYLHRPISSMDSQRFINKTTTIPWRREPIR